MKRQDEDVVDCELGKDGKYRTVKESEASASIQKMKVYKNLKKRKPSGDFLEGFDEGLNIVKGVTRRLRDFEF